MMQIKSALFIKSSPSYRDCPNDDMPLYAFIGRSNVGKSSLINMLTDTKGLAKTSGTPGKTLLINHFLINESFYFVDLPGYGFAKISKTAKKGLREMVFSYLEYTENLQTIFVLIDSRLEPQDIDINFVNWIGEKQLPLCLIFTKSDKLKRNELASNISAYKKHLSKYWENLPKIIITSAELKTGKEEILSFVEEINKSYAG
jgi:GTP-binding protein